MIRFRQIGRARIARANYRPVVEHLEDRRLMSITSSFVNGELVVGTNADDNIIIAADDDGNVVINGLEPQSGTLSAASVQHIHVTGGQWTQVIDLSAVSPNEFAALEGTTIDFDDGSLPAPASLPLLMSNDDSSADEGMGPLPISGIGIVDVPAPIPVPLERSDARRFATLAEALVGSDWSQKLDIPDVDAFLRSHQWQDVVASDQLTQSLDPERVAAFAAGLLGPNWQQDLGVTDLPTFLAGGSWRNWIGGQETSAVPDVLASVDQKLSQFVESAELGAIPAPRTDQWDSLFLPTLDVSTPQIPIPDDQSSLGLLTTGRLTSFAELLVGPEWQEKLGLPDGTVELTKTSYQSLLKNSALNVALDPDRVANFAASVIGPDWSQRLGVDDLASMLRSGAWQKKWLGSDVTSRISLDVLPSIRGTIVQYLDAPESFATELLSEPVSEIGSHSSLTLGPSASLPITITRTIVGTSLNDVIFGTDDNDIIDGGEGDDQIDTKNGNDTVDGAEGHDAIASGDGNSNLDGGEGGDTIDGGEGSDGIYGGTGSDTLDGGEGDDSLQGATDNDQLDGGEGSDTYVFAGPYSLGADTIVTSEVGDTFDFSLLDYGAGIEFDLGTASSTYQVIGVGDHVLTLDLSAEGNEVGNVIGTKYDDVLLGNSLDNRLEGGGGDDLLVGGEGDDYYVFSGTDALGMDTIVEVAGGGQDTLDFGSLDFGTGVTVDLGSASDHYEVVSYNNRPITLDLSGAENQLEGVVGTKYSDWLTGNSLENFIDGHGGGDILSGQGAEDSYSLVESGNSSDRIIETDQEHLDAGAPWQVASGLLQEDSFGQAVAIDSHGNSLHAWLADTGTGLALVGRWFDDVGGPLCDQFTIATGSISQPTIAVNESGQMLVAWQAVQSASATNLYYRRYTLDGNQAVGGNPIQINPSSLTDNQRGSIALLLDGSVIAAWQAIASGGSGHTDVYYQKFGAQDQLLLGASTLVHATAPDTDQVLGRSGTSVAAKADGSFAIAWLDEQQLFVRRFNSSGMPLAAAELVTGPLNQVAGTVIGNPSVFFDGSGNLSVVWWQQVPLVDPPDSSIGQIVLRSYLDAGNSWQQQRLMTSFETDPFGDDVGPQGPALLVATDGMDHIGIVRTSFSLWRVSSVQWFTSEGEPVTAASYLSAGEAAGGTNSTALAANANGVFVVASSLGDGSRARIFKFPPPVIAPELHLPSLGEVPPQTLAVGGPPLSLDLQATYPGGTLGNVRFDISGTIPSGMTLSSSSSVPGLTTLHWTPGGSATVGLYSISVDIWDDTDPAARSRSTIQIWYGAANQVPLVPSITNQTAIVDTPLTLSVSASDPDGAATFLRYGLDSNAPPGAHINPVTGEFRWKPTTSDLGAHTFNVQVTDRGQPPQTTSRSVTITVLPKNIAPTISAPTTVTTGINGSFVFGGSGSMIQVGDSDGDGADLQMTLTASYGQFQLGTTAGLVFVVGSSTNAPVRVLQVRGTAAELNAALSGLAFTADQDFAGAATIEIEITDLGNGGTHPAEVVNQTIAVIVNSSTSSPSISDQAFYRLIANFQDNTTTPTSKVIGAVVATNPDPQRLLRYSIVSGNPLFDIDALTGVLRLKVPNTLSPATSYPVRVRVNYEDTPNVFSEADVTLVVAPANNYAPIANNNSYTVAEFATTSGNILTNDYDQNGDTQALGTLTVGSAFNSLGKIIQLGAITPLPSGALLTLNTDGSVVYNAATISPDYNASTAESFTYTVIDSHGISSGATATVSFQISPLANELHSVLDQIFVIPSNANTATLVGTVVVANRESTGSFTYSIDPASNPNDVFYFPSATSGNIKIKSGNISHLNDHQSYQLHVTVKDNLNRSVAATITVLIGSAPAISSANAWLETSEDVPLITNVFSANSGLLGGVALSAGMPRVVTVSGRAYHVGRPYQLSSGAILRIESDGSLSYDPTAAMAINRLSLGQSVADTVDITFTNDLGTYVSRKITFNVLGRNDAPIPQNDVFKMYAGAPLIGNVLSSSGQIAQDTDPDGADRIFVNAVDGHALTGQLSITTRLGAYLSIKADGSFIYDPTGVSSLATLAVGSHLYDSFLYSISDGVSAGVRDGVAQIEITAGVNNGVPALGVDDFGLLVDTGSSAADRRTSNPTVHGVLTGSALTADHIVVQFDVVAGNLNDTSTTNDYDSTFTADSEVSLSAITQGFPTFSFDPRTNTSFPAGAGHRVIAYRSIAYDASSTQIATTPWSFFSFEVLEPPTQGEIRVTDRVHLYHDTGSYDSQITELNSAQGTPPSTNDPRLSGAVEGDFTGHTVRIEFSYTPFGGGSVITEHVDMTSPGEFIYDPRATHSLNTENAVYSFTYHVYVLNATTGQTEREVTSDTFVFTSVAPAVSQGIVSLIETPGTVTSSYGTTHQIQGTVTGTTQDSVVVELYYAEDQSNQFPSSPNAEVVAIRDATSPTGNLVFQYTAQGLVGVSPRVKAKVREWSDVQGDYVNGPWSATLQFAAPTAPAISSLSVVSTSTVAGPTLAGSLANAVVDGTNPDGTERLQLDVTDAGGITIEFFHRNGPVPTNATPDGTAITDPQGRFEYSPRGLSYGTTPTPISARAVFTVPGTTTKVSGTLTTIGVTLTAPKLPAMATNGFALVSPGTSQTITGNFLQWNTDDPQLTGLLTQPAVDGVSVDKVQIEFAHDYGTSGQSTTVVGYAFPDAEGRFHYTPVGLTNGAVRIRARIAYYDDYSASTLVGSWTDLYLNVSARLNSEITVHDLHLVDPTSTTGTPHAVDPTIAGHLEDAEGYLAFVEVEFRNRTTQAALGSGVTDANGTFTVTLSGISVGTTTVEARARDWDYQTRQFVWGPWTPLADSLTFALDLPTALSLANFALHSDTGSSQSDEHTANPLLFGQVTGAESLSGVTIGLDFGDNGSIDATVETDEEGLFSYLPVGLANGAYTVRAKLGTWNAAAGVFDYSTGSLVHFALESQANAAAKLIELALAHPPAGGEAVVDATLLGRIINEGTVEGVTVDFDYDTEDTNGVNQSAASDNYGRIRFVPTLLPAGTANIRARVREWVASTASWLTSSWMTVPTFNYQPSVTAPAISGYGLASAPDSVGPPVVTHNPQLAGTIAGTVSVTGTVVEFSFTQDGPVIGSASVSATTRQFTFTPPNLALGGTYTVWARTKVTDGQTTIYGASSSTTFKYALAAGQVYLASLSLSSDTAAEAGSTSTDGVTSNSEIIGQISSLASGVSINIDVGADNVGIFQVQTQSNGMFSYPVPTAGPGYYTVRVGIGSNWRRVNFVYNLHDGDTMSLDLASAMTAINSRWQLIDADFESLYQLSQSASDSQRDYDLAIAALERDESQRAADASYEQQRTAADASYEAALAQARTAFNTALAGLPDADRAAYSSLSFVWPKTPADNALIIPADELQPSPPLLPDYVGPAFDSARDATYRAAVAEADRQYALDVRSANEQYRESLPDIEDEYKDDVQEAYDTYKDNQQHARDEYDDLREGSPVFDDEAWQQLVESARGIWNSYRDSLSQARDAYYSRTAEASKQRSNATQQLSSEKSQEVDAAWDAYNSHPSPTTYTTLNRKIYDIRKNYAPKFEKVDNEWYDESNNADHDRSVASQAALHTALVGIYAVQRQMAEFGRDFSHEQLTDRLSDSHQYSVDLADAQKQLQEDLATAQATRTKAVAEKANVRDRQTAQAVADRDNQLATARYNAIHGWAVLANSPWSAYQSNLALAEKQYQEQLIDLALTRDQSFADAVMNESSQVADATAQRTIDRAAAERDRTSDLDSVRLQFQVDVDAKYVDRDARMASAWYDRQVATADAANVRNTAQADITLEYELEKDHAIAARDWGYSWATYDLYEYYDAAPWSGIVIDNSETRIDLRETWQSASKTAIRDSDVASSYNNETYDIARIGATETYRTATNDIFHDAAVQITGHNRDYRVDVADVQDDYNESIAAAAARYSVELARAEASRKLDEAQANADFDLAAAPLDEEWHVSEATLLANYEGGVAASHLATVQNWATTAADAWHAYQVSLAQAELDRVTDSGQASILHASDTWEANLRWVEATTNANLAIAIELYDPDEGAFVERVQSIAHAEVDIAESRGLGQYVEVQAEATKDHDQGVADANLVFYDELAGLDASRDRALRHASAERSRAYSEVVFAAAAPADISQADKSAQDKAINDHFNLAVAQINATRAISAAQARASWTAAVGSLNVGLVTDQVAAQADRAAQLQFEVLALAAATCDADVQFATRSAEAIENNTIAIATADATDAIAVAEADGQFTATNTAIEGRQSVAITVARNTYELQLHAEHVAATDNLQNGSPLSSYQASVAIVDRDWVAYVAAARIQHATVIAGLESTHAAALNAANIGLARLSAPVDVDRATEQAALVREQSIRLAQIDADLYYNKKLAETNLTIDQSGVQGDADIAYASAVRDRDNAYAQANVQWVTTSINAYVDVYSKALGGTPQFDQDYNNVIAAAREALDDAKKQADDEFTKATDDTGSQVPVDIAELRLNYVLAVAAAKTQHIAEQNETIEDFARGSAELSVKSVQDQNWINQTHGSQVATADHVYDSSLAWADVPYDQSLRDADANRAGNRAAAEVVYHIGNAHSETVQLQALATASSSSELRAQAAASAAKESWLAALAIPYQNYQTAIAYHDGQLNVDIASALAGREEARSTADLEEEISEARYSREQAFRIAHAQSEDEIAQLLNENTLQAAIVDAENELAIGRVKADAQNVVDLDINRRKYRSTDRTNADKEANFNRAEAFADAEFDWRLATADAEHDFAVAELARHRTLSLQTAEIAHYFSSQTARSEAGHSIALAQAERSYWISETAADNLHREHVAQAEVAFISAQYDAKTAATAGALVTNLHRADGQIHGITAGYADGDLAFAANMWGAGTDNGEFRVTGTTFTKHASAGGGSVSVTPVNSGIAVSDSATGTGYIMYSATSVFTRFSAHPEVVGNADHFIAVRYDGSQWQYNDNANWYSFTPASSDVLVAEVDFSNDTIRGLGGDLPWAGYERDMTAAERAAWEGIKDDYLQRESDISAAQAAFTLIRGNAYLFAMQANAYDRLSLLLQTANAVLGEAEDVAELQAEFSQELAGITDDYREAVADAERTYAVDSAKALKLGQSTSPATSARTTAITAAENKFKSDYRDRDTERITGLADIGYQFTVTTANLLAQEVGDSVSNESDFDRELANAFYSEDGNSGLQVTLANINYNYTILEAGAFATAMSSLATNHPSAWAAFSHAEADVRRDEKIGPMAEQARNRQLAYANADRSYNLDVSDTDLEQSLAAVRAANANELTRAAQMRAKAMAQGGTADVALPAALTLPATSDLGSVTILTNNYAVTHPGSISDGWYSGYLGGYTNLAGMWQWSSWYGSDTYYWGDYGRYGYGGIYGYFYYGAEYGYPYLVGGYAPWGYYYGYWGYSPGYFGWGGWSANYGVTPPAGLSGNQVIDVDAIDALYEETLKGLLGPSSTTGTAAAKDEDQAPPTFDPVSGDLGFGNDTEHFGPVAQGMAETAGILDRLITQQAEQSHQDQHEQHPLSANASPAASSPSPSEIASRETAETALADGFEIDVRGNQVYYAPYTLVHSGRALSQQHGVPIRLGILDNQGWVLLTEQLGGGRAALSALEKAATLWSNYERRALLPRLDFNEAPIGTTTLRELIDGSRSLMFVNQNSSNQNAGIFLGGTGQQMLDLGNVERMYNQYQGTKFYIGGIGNEVDSEHESFSGGVAVGAWNIVLDRALQDVLRAKALGATKIHIFGFSRGAAEAIELAKRLKPYNVDVDFLGLYDPVYSVYLPGRNSSYIRPFATEQDFQDGKNGNYVNATVTSNVDDVFVMYSMNERRPEFAATQLIPEDSTKTSIMSVGAPGVHSDIGGHWNNNQYIQQLTMHYMLDAAKKESTATFVFTGVDAQLQALLDSDYTRYLIGRGTDQNVLQRYESWLVLANSPEFWRGYSTSDYLAQIVKTDSDAWRPGPIGIQVALGYARNLPWVEFGLWDLYPGAKSTEPFIRNLYNLIAHSEGGWRRAWRPDWQWFKVKPIRDFGDL